MSAHLDAVMDVCSGLDGVERASLAAWLTTTLPILGTTALIEVIRSALTSLESLPPAERDLVTRAIVSDLRARDPESVSILTLGPPTERTKG